MNLLLSWSSSIELRGEGRPGEDRSDEIFENPSRWTPILMVSVQSPRGEIHNLRLDSGGVGSKGLGFSLCRGLPMHSCASCSANMLASGVRGMGLVLSGFIHS